MIKTHATRGNSGMNKSWITNEIKDFNINNIFK